MIRFCYPGIYLQTYLQSITKEEVFAAIWSWLGDTIHFFLSYITLEGT